MSAAPEPSLQDEPTKPSCNKYFDALWWCFSPGNQLANYYIQGKVDDCTSTWSDLFTCLGGTDPNPDAPTARCSLWELRSRQEAAAFWGAEFKPGTVNPKASPPAAAEGSE